MRAIWNLVAPYAANKSPERVEVGVKIAGRLLDEANRRGLVTWAGLREAVEREDRPGEMTHLTELASAAKAAGDVGGIAKRGRAGTVIMRAASEKRPPGTSATESRNETRFEEILAEARLPQMDRQVVVGGREPIGRGDFRGRNLPLVAEVNSITYHTTPSDREKDQVRYQRFKDAGHSVAVVWEDDLWKHPQNVVHTMIDARNRTLAGERVILHTPSCPWPGHALAA